ncbi:MAG TPA: SURF1 family protein [Casimicrobiaceae bacterium]|nr:SURF1 family protein [Casimicrobiaceae bacterium]
MAVLGSPGKRSRARDRDGLRRALLGVVTIAAVTLFLLAGNWQRGRMLQKEELGRQLQAALAAPTEALPTGDVRWSDWRYRTIELRGRFLGDKQVLIDNRIHRGRVGYHVVTPLALDDGRFALVNRGFVAAGPSRDVLPSIPAPSAAVTVRGRVNFSERYLELAQTPFVGRVWQNLDPVRFAAVTGIPVLPIIVEETTAASDGLVRDWPRPDVGTDKHRIYMMQWYAFAALAVALWVWFGVIRKRSA